MRLHRIISFFVGSVLLLVAAKAADETAVVMDGKINVRGQPSFVGEVITQLQKGDKVAVLERITIEKPRAGEPTNWARIKLPQNTPVWVFAPFVRDGAVAATRLNLRAGPGENYSVVGRLMRGDAVKTIRTVEEWMEVEAPADAFAFVDLDLLQFDGAPRSGVAAVPGTAVTPPLSKPGTNDTRVAAAATKRVETPKPDSSSSGVPRSNPVVVQKPAQGTPPPTELKFSDVTLTTVPGTTAASSTQPEQPSAVSSTTPSPTAVTAALPKVGEPAPPKLSGPLPKRVVRREGFVRPTKSIQAPTWYELANPETKKTINYLFEDNLGINLKEYRGQKVVVSGEEAIDPRWPGTPILELQTLDILP